MLLLVMCTTNTAARKKTTKPLADSLVVATEASSDSCLIILGISENTKTSYLKPTPYRTDMASTEPKLTRFSSHYFLNVIPKPWMCHGVAIELFYC